MWIKQHLRIKHFHRDSENAAKTQEWTTVAIHVLVAIVRTRPGLDLCMHATLPVPSITPLVKVHINHTFIEHGSGQQAASDAKQRMLLSTSVER